MSDQELEQLAALLVSAARGEGSPLQKASGNDGMKPSVKQIELIREVRLLRRELLESKSALETEVMKARDVEKKTIGIMKELKGERNARINAAEQLGILRNENLRLRSMCEYMGKQIATQRGRHQSISPVRERKSKAALTSRTSGDIEEKETIIANLKEKNRSLEEELQRQRRRHCFEMATKEATLHDTEEEVEFLMSKCARLEGLVKIFEDAVSYYPRESSLREIAIQQATFALEAHRNEAKQLYLDKKVRTRLLSSSPPPPPQQQQQQQQQVNHVLKQAKEIQEQFDRMAVQLQERDSTVQVLKSEVSRLTTKPATSSIGVETLQQSTRCVETQATLVEQQETLENGLEDLIKKLSLVIKALETACCQNASSQDWVIRTALDRAMIRLQAFEATLRERILHATRTTQVFQQLQHVQQQRPTTTTTTTTTPLQQQQAMPRTMPASTLTRLAPSSTPSSNIIPSTSSSSLTTTTTTTTNLSPNNYKEYFANRGNQLQPQDFVLLNEYVANKATSLYSMLDRYFAENSLRYPCQTLV